MSIIFSKKLKPLNSLNPPVVIRSDDDASCIQEIDKHYVRVINSTMRRKFGNGFEYHFITYREDGRYTHKCMQDNYCYHESWFVEDEDFLEKELFEI